VKGRDVLYWRTEPPDQPGYWFFDSATDELPAPIILRVYLDRETGALKVRYPYFPTDVREFRDTKWSGPIAEPLTPTSAP
jgi:hypothetical protein